MHNLLFKTYTKVSILVQFFYLVIKNNWPVVIKITTLQKNTLLHFKVQNDVKILTIYKAELWPLAVLPTFMHHASEFLKYTYKTLSHNIIYINVSLILN
jgi:hypothetical protein